MKKSLIRKSGLLLLSLIFSALLLIFPHKSPAAGDFEVIINTSRTQGVAPLSVFFDATQTPDLADGSYIDATFAWNFDMDNTDPGANYIQGSGFVAAHVFENPGTYRVRVNVYDTLGRQAYEEVVITVLPFTGTTYYVAEDGSDQNDGLSMNSPFLTVNHALNGSHVQPNTRILFKNGDTFYVSALVNVGNKNGPIIIGGYSDPTAPSSAKPIIYSTCADSAYSTINFDNSNDIRIMDIAVRATGESSVNPRYPGGISMYHNTSHILKYRTEEYLNGNMSMSPCGQYNTVAESSYHDTTNTGYCSDAGTNTDNAIIGNKVYDKNLVDQSNEEHVFRLQGGSRWYIAHNTFGPNVRVNHDILTIRGDTDKVVIYKNIIYDYVTNIRPQNKNSAEEYQHHCVIDSNLFIGSNTPQIAISLRSKDIVVRNNIIYNYAYGIGIGYDTVVGPTSRIKIYNNTMINPGLSSSSFVYVENGCPDIEVYNNLHYDIAGTPNNQTSFLQLRNSSTLDGASDYNALFSSINDWSSYGLFGGQTLSAWQAASGNDQNSLIIAPSLVSMDINSPDSQNFCRPGVSSELINKGAFTGAALDYHGNLRDLSRDIGAVEYTGGVLDTQSPSAPTGLTANPFSSSEIDLFWSASSDNVGVAGYHIYRNSVRVGTTVGTTFHDTGCNPATSYDYTVRAYDATGNVSLSSNTASTTTNKGQGTTNTGQSNGSTGSGVEGGGGCFISTTVAVDESF